MELQRHYLSPRVTSITPGNTPLTYAFQPLKPLPEPTLEINRDYLIPTKPYSPEILKKILASITNGVTNPKGSNKRAIQLKTTHFVTHRSSGTTTPLNEKQSPDESHCIPRTFSDPSSTHLSWNSRMTSSPTWVLLEPHWVRHMPASLIITLASLVISQACTWSSHPEIQLSTYMLLVSSSTTGEVGYWDKWYLMVAFNRNGLLLLPDGTRVNLITRVTPWSFQKNRCTSRSTGCTPTWRKALVMSAHKANFQRLNLIKIPSKSGIKLGPVSRQSFSDTLLWPLAEVSKTGRTLVLILDSFTTGLWGI